jgi:CBS domain-containing protein
MNVKVNELMVSPVMTLSPHQTVGHAKNLMLDKQIHSLPVTGSDGQLVGIISMSDLLDGAADGTPVSKVMSTHVYTVPQYADPSVAARVMRNHKIHHVVVTHEQQIVGTLSSFDLLKLVEDHRFAMKQAPQKQNRHPRADKVGRARGA